MTTFIIPVGGCFNHDMVNHMQRLATDKAWKITVEEYRPRRTHDQNAYLWGVCYRTIKEQLLGWDLDDIHEFFMGECFGWETIEGLGGLRLRPLRHSSKLSVEEFSQYIDFVHRRAAEHGIYIRDPE